MASSQSDNSDSKFFPAQPREEVDTYEDEINLIDYFIILWKRKWFILLASALPTLLVGLTLFFWPRDYKVTYIYEIGLNEKDYKILFDKFYSAENLDKIIAKLKNRELDNHGKEIAKANSVKELRKLVDFEVSPSYFETLDTPKTTDVRNLQEIQQIRGTLLAMNIVGRPKSNMDGISLTIRDNFEKVVPIYSVKQELNSTIISLKNTMANIENQRFSLELKLETKKKVLTKLRSVKSEDINKTSSDIILQFDNIDVNSPYLPLSHQIQATESIIINLEETISANEEYKYYKDLLSLNERLLNEVDSKSSSYYTIQEFHPFLTNIASDYKDNKLVDYLNAYIKKIENLISTSIPIIEKSRVFPVPKGTVKKTLIIFAVLLTITTFAAFLLEATSKRQVQPS